MRRPFGRGGFSLIELIIALGLSLLVLAAMGALTGTAVRYQVQGLRSASAQMNAALAFKEIEREMSEATYLLAPALGGLPSQTLRACANAQRSLGGAAFVPIDAARPMRFFAFCQSGGTLYHYSLTGCPAAYVCGVNPASAVGKSASPVSAAFLRPSGGGVLRVDVGATAGGVSSLRGGSFSVAVAAGMNP